MKRSMLLVFLLCCSMACEQPDAAAPAPVPVIQENKSDVPVGQIGVFSGHGENQEVGVAKDRATLDELIRAKAAQSELLVKRLVDKGGLFVEHTGNTALLIQRDKDCMMIQILLGDHPGSEGWIHAQDLKQYETPEHLRKGKRVRVLANYGKHQFLLCLDKKTFDGLNEAIAKNDRERLDEIEGSSAVIKGGVGASAEVLEDVPGACQIRIESGYFTGRQGWIRSVFLSGSN